MQYVIIDDIDELASLVNNLLTVRHIIDSNIQYPKYSHLENYMSYLEYKLYNNDIALYFREMVTSAVLESAVNAYRNYTEVNPFLELTKAGLKEHRLLDEFTDMEFIAEFDLEDKKVLIDGLFRLCVDKLTDNLISYGLLDKYKHISLGDVMMSGIVVGVTNEDLKVLEER